MKGKNALNTELEELKSELVKLQQAQRDSATALRMVESAASQYESMQQTCDEDAKEFEALVRMFPTIPAGWLHLAAICLFSVHRFKPFCRMLSKLHRLSLMK